MARLNGNGVPAVGLVVASLLATVMIGMNYTQGLVAIFKLLVLLSTLTTLLPYAASSLAAIAMARREGRTQRGRDLAIALGALAFSLFAMIGSGLDILLYGLALLAAGVPIYWYQRRRGAIRQVPA